MKNTILKNIENLKGRNVNYLRNHIDEVIAYFETTTGYEQMQFNDLVNTDYMSSTFMATNKVENIVEIFKENATRKPKFKLVKEKSNISESVYYNIEIYDAKLENEFDEVIPSHYRTIRKSNHKRPAVVNGVVAHEHDYLVNTNSNEVFMTVKKEVEKLMKAWTTRKITIEELEKALDEIKAKY